MKFVTFARVAFATFLMVGSTGIGAADPAVSPSSKPGGVAYCEALFAKVLAKVDSVTTDHAAHLKQLRDEEFQVIKTHEDPRTWQRFEAAIKDSLAFNERDTTNLIRLVEAVAAACSTNR
jgi:hypothetical protein